MLDSKHFLMSFALGSDTIICKVIDSSEKNEEKITADNVTETSESDINLDNSETFIVNL